MWRWYLRLDEKRRMGINGVEALNHPDMVAWMAATRTYPTAAEVEAIDDIDRAFMQRVRVKRGEAPAPAEQGASKREIATRLRLAMDSMMAKPKGRQARREERQPPPRRTRPA